MKGFRAALEFLTIFPFRKSCLDEKLLAQAPPYFPVVGVLIGLFVAVLDYALAFLPLGPRSVLTCAALAFVSGGLHLDGLADTADGLLSGQPRDAALRIMRDPQSGPMGVAAVAFVVVLKVAILMSLPGSGRFTVICFIPIAGRVALTMTMAFFSYARDNGTARPMAKQRRSFGWGAAGFLLAVGLILRGWRGTLEGIAVIGFVVLFGVYLKRRLDGYTGDTLGAVCELAEVIAGLTVLG